MLSFKILGFLLLSSSISAQFLQTGSQLPSANKNILPPLSAIAPETQNIGMPSLTQSSFQVPTSLKPASIANQNSAMPELSTLNLFNSQTPSLPSMDPFKSSTQPSTENGNKEGLFNLPTSSLLSTNVAKNEYNSFPSTLSSTFIPKNTKNTFNNFPGITDMGNNLNSGNSPKLPSSSTLALPPFPFTGSNSSFFFPKNPLASNNSNLPLFNNALTNSANTLPNESPISPTEISNRVTQKVASSDNSKNSMETLYFRPVQPVGESGNSNSSWRSNSPSFYYSNKCKLVLVTKSQYQSLMAQGKAKPLPSFVMEDPSNFNSASVPSSDLSNPGAFNLFNPNSSPIVRPPRLRKCFTPQNNVVEPMIQNPVRPMRKRKCPTPLPPNNIPTNFNPIIPPPTKVEPSIQTQRPIRVNKCEHIPPVNVDPIMQIQKTPLNNAPMKNIPNIPPPTNLDPFLQQQRPLRVNKCHFPTQEKVKPMSQTQPQDPTIPNLKFLHLVKSIEVEWLHGGLQQYTPKELQPFSNSKCACIKPKLQRRLQKANKDLDQLTQMIITLGGDPQRRCPFSFPASSPSIFLQLADELKKISSEATSEVFSLLQQSSNNENIIQRLQMLYQMNPNSPHKTIKDILSFLAPFLKGCPKQQFPSHSGNPLSGPTGISF